MRQESQDVEIKDPAVKQMKNKEDKSCLKRGCSKGCIFLILLFIAFLFIIKFGVASKTKEVKDVPENFPDDISVYDKDSINSIQVSREENNVFAKIGKIFPKTVLVTLHLTLGSDSPEELKNYLQVKHRNLTDKNLPSKFWTLMQEAPKQKEEKIIIKWKNLSADIQFLKEYYESSLKESNFEVELTTNQDIQKQILFNKQNYVGKVYIKDDPKNPGTTLMKLELSIKPNS